VITVAERVLIDTSAWVDFFRGVDPVREAVRSLVLDDAALRCGPVELELRHGLRRHDVGEVVRVWYGLQLLPTDELDFTSAGDLLRDLREGSFSIPSMDALIATLALRHQVPLLAVDRHFDAVPGLQRYPVAG